MATPLEYTSAKAERLIIAGNAPANMKVTGSLDLRGPAITALPDGLTVGGSLDLRGTAITALPDGLTVGGSLDLSGTAITALPDGLTVGGSLDLRGAAITALPDGLTVGGSLYLRGASNLHFPTQWWSVRGEATRRRGIAACAMHGYVLVQTDSGKYSAGCRGPWTAKQALAHWGKRDDSRAIAFAAAIAATEAEPAK